MSDQIFTAKLNKVHIGPKKLGLIRDLVAGKNAAAAENMLSFSLTKGAALIKKPLMSAISAAKEKGVKKEELKISELRIDGAGYRKAGRFASRGRFQRIRKPLSHIFIKLVKEEHGTAS